ncbi:unnamed protein product [Phytomonas sp. Hart1]|nr:unnamed protein product [Phytomonas sp. Hart1]|eukprot:CCW70053.1 unnamed protein product [Phytomonas sp. isolate Hart1]
MNSEIKTIYNALPNLPGFNFSELHEPASHGLHHHCILSKEGTRVVLNKNNSAVSHEPLSGCGIPVRTILDKFPMWKTLDDKVIRFFGYYIDEISNSSLESGVCVRKVKLHYYLADGTLAIIETPSSINSGLRKGTTASRFKPENVDVFSFCIDGSITTRGITYKLVDCDAATREFYDVMGMPQPEQPLGYPFDSFEAPKYLPSATVNEENIAMRRVFEAQAAIITGTHPSLLSKEERERAHSYYANDGKVLRYFAVWEKRLFRIHYYLADGSISVMFDTIDNDGRDRNRVFIRRTCIPKNFKTVLLQTETLNRPRGVETSKYISAEDLRTGTTVDLFTRQFFIFDCDSYTRNYMKKHYEMELPVHECPPTEMGDILLKKEKTGSPSRSSNWYDATKALEPNQSFGASAMMFGDSQREMNTLKLTRLAHDVFRFLARIVNPHPSDKDRKFIISYYLADDTVSVFELVIRNSGHVGGKIFARRGVEGVENPRKLQVGHTIRLDGVEYLLEEMDQRTQNYIEAGMLDRMDDAYYQMDEIIATMRQHVLQQFSSTTEAYRHYASSRINGLTAENVKEIFSDSDVRLDDALLEKVMDRVDSDHDGWISLADFTEHLLGQKLISDFQPGHTFAARVEEGLDTQLNIPILRGPIQSATSIAQLANTNAAAAAAFRKFIAVMEARRTLLIRTFRNVATGTYDGNLGMDDVKDCLTTRLKVPLSDEELNALLYKFFYIPTIPNWTARRLTVNEVQQLIRL